MAQNYLFRRVFVQGRTRRSGWSKAGSDPGSVPCRRPSEPCPNAQTCLQQPIEGLFSYAPNLQGWIAVLHMLGRLVIIITFYVTMSTLLWIEVICRAKSEVCTPSRLSGTPEKVCFFFTFADVMNCGFRQPESLVDLPETHKLNLQVRHIWLILTSLPRPV